MSALSAALLLPSPLWAGKISVCVASNPDNSRFCCKTAQLPSLSELQGTNLEQACVAAQGGLQFAGAEGGPKCEDQVTYDERLISVRGYKVECSKPMALNWWMPAPPVVRASPSPLSSPAAPVVQTPPASDVQILLSGQVHHPKAFFSTGYFPFNSNMEGGHWGAYHVKDPSWPLYPGISNKRREKVAPVISLYEYLNGDDILACPRKDACTQPSRFKPAYVSLAVDPSISRLGVVGHMPDVERWAREVFAKDPEALVVLPHEKYPTKFLRKYPQVIKEKSVDFETRVKAQIAKIQAVLIQGPIPFVAQDTGGKIKGRHIDICTGDREFNASHWPTNDKDFYAVKGRRINDTIAAYPIFTNGKQRTFEILPDDQQESMYNYFERVLLKAARLGASKNGDPSIYPTESLSY